MNRKNLNNLRWIVIDKLKADIDAVIEKVLEELTPKVGGFVLHLYNTDMMYGIWYRVLFDKDEWKQFMVELLQDYDISKTEAEELVQSFHQWDFEDLYIGHPKDFLTFFPGITVDAIDSYVYVAAFVVLKWTKLEVRIHKPFEIDRVIAASAYVASMINKVLVSTLLDMIRSGIEFSLSAGLKQSLSQVLKEYDVDAEDLLILYNKLTE